MAWGGKGEWERIKVQARCYDHGEDRIPTDKANHATYRSTLNAKCWDQDEGENELKYQAAYHRHNHGALLTCHGEKHANGTHKGVEELAQHQEYQRSRAGSKVSTKD